MLIAFYQLVQKKKKNFPHRIVFYYVRIERLESMNFPKCT